MNHPHRHPHNSNLQLYSQSHYLGFPVQTARGPLVLNYLERLHETMQRALNEHPRTFAFRADLRLPAGFDMAPYDRSNEVVRLFIESFKEQIKHNRSMAKQKNLHAHDCTVRYVRAREIGAGGKPHFHFVFFLNRDAYYTFGSFENDGDNLFNRLQKAWARALGLPVNAVAGLVEIPEGAWYHLRRNEPATMTEFFHRASYVCKAATKAYGDGCHAFDASRR